MPRPELHEPEQQDFRSAVARGVCAVRRLLQNQGVQKSTLAARLIREHMDGESFASETVTTTSSQLPESPQKTFEASDRKAMIGPSGGTMESAR